MKNDNAFERFARGKENTTSQRKNNNAVIYTRVSTREQAVTNQSLETQKKYCLEFALKGNYNVLGFFGGTYESAKTDERNEFNRMIKFVRNQKEGVSYILVYSLDRFSRTGDNAIFISGELKRQGISIISVTQPIDVSTHAGILQQNIQFIFSKYDNDLRKEKCMVGMKEKLLRGEWIGCTPAGYSYQHSGDRKLQRIVLNEKAHLIKQAFQLKVQGVTNTEIAARISTTELKISKKRLTEILRNPFYCGYISHAMLEGKIVKGKHVPLITEEMFLLANEVSRNRTYGYGVEKNINIPLKNFVRCSECETPLTAYIVKKKGLYYYKCNKIGCRCNRSVKHMHARFAELLKKYEIDKKLIEPLKDQLVLTYHEFTKADSEHRRQLKQQLADVSAKLDKVEERFVLGEIERELYERIGGKLKQERRKIEDESEAAQKKLSNPVDFVTRSLNLCSNLSDFWVSGDFNDKIKLQEILFPEGIHYDKKNDDYRTTRVNAMLTLIHSLPASFGNKKSGKSKEHIEFSASVPKAGIEPAHLAVHDFESCASTSSATQAWLR